MSFMRRIISFDKKGRKYVTYQSMGDDASDGVELDAPGTTLNIPSCPGDSSWNEQLKKCVAPDDAGSGISDLVSSVTDTLKSAGAAIFGATSSAATSAGSAAATATSAPSGTSPLVVAAGLAVGAYLLFGKSRRKRR